MTEFEQQLIENLTKQLDAHNKIKLKKIQNESSWEDKLHNAEIEYLETKKKMFKNISDLIAVIGTIIIIATIVISMIILPKLITYASNF